MRTIYLLVIHKKLISVASGVDMDDEFQQVLTTVYKFRLVPSHLEKLKDTRQEELQQEPS